MIAGLLEYCGSPSFLSKLMIVSNLTIAFSYFAIPIAMAIVLRHRRTDIPYPWLWLLFVVFIVACGCTHIVHVWLTLGFDVSPVMVGVVSLITALASCGTAIALITILPEIKELPSPTEQKQMLETAVALRTAEKDRLIREINHQVGNQLQIMGSAVSMEERKAGSEETVAVLSRLRDILDKLFERHRASTVKDYLEEYPGLPINPSGPFEIEPLRKIPPS